MMSSSTEVERSSDHVYCMSNTKYQDIIEISNLQIDKGWIVAIVGPSGSGKTTLLRLLNKLISPTDGDIFFDGRDLRDIDSVELRRRVIMLQQTPVVFEGSVYQNLVIGCSLAEKKEPTESEVRKYLEMVKLTVDMDSDVSTLSGGEEQRLALARVLLMDPEVLLLDEPSSALDADAERVIFDVITEYARERERTLIMVTHSESMAREYAEVIVSIDNGEIKSIEEMS